MSNVNRIVMLKQQRAHLAAFGQTEKVKAIDIEIAKLRQAQDEPEPPTRKPRKRAAKPTADMETADADTSSVETATASPRRRSRYRD